MKYKRTMKNINLKIDAEFHSEIKAKLVKDNKQLNTLVVELLLNYLDQNDD
jgi:predicted HicB family RNase H-like nuclease